MVLVLPWVKEWTVAVQKSPKRFRVRFLLGKQNRASENLARYTGQSDARRFYRQYFVDALALVKAVQLPGHFGKEHGVHEVVQKPVYLQYAAGQDYPVLRYAALKKLQGAHSHPKSNGLRRYKNHFYDTTSFLRAQLAF